MKKILLPFYLMYLVCRTASAKVITISNDTENPAQYSEFQAAVDDASPGDTLYLHGSTKSYGAVSISKQLVIIGTGYKPDKERPFVSKVESIQLWNDMTNNTSASGSKITGLTIGHTLSLYDVQNITIERSHVFTVATSSSGEERGTSNIVIAENYIANISLQLTNEIVIRNNVIWGGVYDHQNANSQYTSLNVGIFNNVFIAHQSSAGGITDALTVNDAAVANNIFYGVFPDGAINSTFSNNILFETGTQVFPQPTNSAANNLLNTDPEFVNFPYGDPTGLHPLDYDYHLKDSSPGKNAGTDGTDIGIYGGQGFHDGGEPPIPIIREFTILNSLVPQHGTLNIRIKASTVN